MSTTKAKATAPPVDSVIHVRVPGRLKLALSRLAEKQRRKEADLIRLILEDAVAKDGRKQ